MLTIQMQNVRTGLLIIARYWLRKNCDKKNHSLAIDEDICHWVSTVYSPQLHSSRGNLTVCKSQMHRKFNAKSKSLNDFSFFSWLFCFLPEIDASIWMEPIRILLLRHLRKKKFVATKLLARFNIWYHFHHRKTEKNENCGRMKRTDMVLFVNGRETVLDVLQNAACKWYSHL